MAENSATRALTEILEQVGLEIADDAKDLATHAHRKTINGEDIKLAYTRLVKKSRKS